MFTVLADVGPRMFGGGGCTSQVSSYEVNQVGVMYSLSSSYIRLSLLPVVLPDPLYTRTDLQSLPEIITKLHSRSSAAPHRNN